MLFFLYSKIQHKNQDTVRIFKRSTWGDLCNGQNSRIFGSIYALTVGEARLLPFFTAFLVEKNPQVEIPVESLLQRNIDQSQRSKDLSNHISQVASQTISVPKTYNKFYAIPTVSQVCRGKQFMPDELFRNGNSEWVERNSYHCRRDGEC